MIVARSITEVARETNSVVTVGTFDGVHRAHQEIVREVVLRAKQNAGRSVVITFDPHPKEVVASKRGPVQLLTTIDERIELLNRQQIDLLVIIPFTYEFSQQTSREFYERTVVGRIGVSEVVVGYDHTFGRNREGGIEELVRMGEQQNFSVFALPPFSVDGEIVSSTRVRNALLRGEIEHATTLLGHEYQLSGAVVVGDRRGTTLGYPTANIRPKSDKKLVPANGVYLVGVEVEGRHYHGMMNIGVRPTLTAGLQETIEVHIFDFADDIYGERITVSFLRKLRDEQKFASLQDLVSQLHEDKAQSLKYLAKSSSPKEK
ncbi:MAG: bifunctional riboflavin kinase/FAD synthetase [Ignavibacteriae bacterium]|nr:bifunctional riboflavin kinase/FAD synthetase [Ignavibacteriota bacterium]